MAPATVTRHVDDDLEAAVAGYSEPVDAPETTETNGNTPARGRVKFTGDLNAHERELRARSEVRLNKKINALRKTFDERVQKYRLEEEEKVQTAMGEAALRVEGATINNPEAVAAGIARRIEAQQKSIAALQEKLASLTAA